MIQQPKSKVFHNNHKPLQLYGFNNLTKTLSFNIYDICYAETLEDRQAYIAYIDEEYNSERLTGILEQVATIIGANILNIAKQDYYPQGASVTVLISEEKVVDPNDPQEECPPENGGDVVMHLDKSHLTVHTYPESHPENGICTFRVDIDVSTCGKISPLKALNFLLDSFDSDIVNLDYRVRGFTRRVDGTKIFIDQKLNSIQNFIASDTLSRYHSVDLNVYQDNIFHTKMILRDFELNNYLFGVKEEQLNIYKKRRIVKKLKKEMNEIFYAKNLPSSPVMY
ncbi:adenosylmethionine decarboxylase [bacterium]|nr:adenosylmethionine decarboxylase [bacterium]